MTVLSAQTIRRLGIVTPLLEAHRGPSGNSAGLSCCGYDLISDDEYRVLPGRFVLAATVEMFRIPTDVVGIVHDKSSLARRGLAVQNTVLEPGWRGHVTLELTNHGVEKILILSGDPIAQVVFHRLDEPTDSPYAGRYQDQEAGPQAARPGLTTTVQEVTVGGDESRRVRGVVTTEYRCGVCGSRDLQWFMNCQHPGCPDGRDR